MEQAQQNGVPGDCLIFVHGRDFKPSATELLDLNIAALSAAIERDRPELLECFHQLQKQLSYYGDFSNQFLLESGGHYDESLDIGDRRNALLKLKSLGKTKHFGVTRYDRLPGKTAIAEFAADVAAPLLGSIGLSKALISSVARDLAEYWNDKSEFASNLRNRVRNTLIESLSRGDRIMLVSHGTGSIVSFDVLWQLSHDPEYAERYSTRKIDSWLTLGSPLGDSMVRRRLLGADRKGRERFPTNILTWHNVSAEDDYMCHDNTLADDYKQMLKLHQVSSIRDYHIYNLSVRYGKSNPHSSVGYLMHPRTAQIVADWIRQKPADPLPTNIL
ncbi:MAG: hypothetical protein OEW68_04280 [Gammaproteobacteria bacterium]|nr:hypothetical protein [Gammaproteobacteria bacterium]